MPSHKNIPTVCIVGRPNVGKSSLFNCIVGYRRAVVLGESGTTRDRLEDTVIMGGKRIRVIDTGGFLIKDTDHLSAHVKNQIMRAMEDASLLLFVTDIQTGITPADREVALLLRKFNKPVILAANKADNDGNAQDSFELFQLGYGEPVLVSCAHRRGINGLKDRIMDTVRTLFEFLPDGEKEDPGCIKVAVIGRPNVGKSSFINKLTESDRVIVSDIPGTTRDSIDTRLDHDGDSFILIDTAGMRHKRKIKNAVDVYSIMRSEESIARADVVVFMLDASEGIAKDDLEILRFTVDKGKACLIVVNKWDLAKDVEDVTAAEYEKHLVRTASQIADFPVMFVSALTGHNVMKILAEVKKLNEGLDLKVPTPKLNKIFSRNKPANVPIPKKKKRPNFLYIVQSGTRPIEFTYFVNDPEAVLPAHMSYIENRLRESLAIRGIPVRINIKRSKKGKKT